MCCGNDEIAYFNVCWKTRKVVSSTASNQELKPMSTVQIKNVSIGQESLVYGKSSVVERIYQESKFWVQSKRVMEWYVKQVEKRTMGRDKHEDVKLVHEVKQDANSRGEARHTENSSQW